MQRFVSMLASAFVMTVLVAQGLGAPRVLQGGGPTPHDGTNSNGPALTGTVVVLQDDPPRIPVRGNGNGPALTGTVIELKGTATPPPGRSSNGPELTGTSVE